MFDLNASVDEKIVRQELRKLGRSFVPADVVRLASNPKSPLHQYFEWNNSKAAAKWRLSQARHLVLSVEIQDGIRAYESVVVAGKRSYVSASDIIRSADLIDQVLNSALDELIYWKDKNQRYKNYFGGVFDSITVAEKTIRRKNGKNEKGGGARNKARNTANKKVNSDGHHLRRIASAGK